MMIDPFNWLRPDPGPNDHFTVAVGTRGVGPGSFAYSSYDLVPTDDGVFPEIEVEYPAVAGRPPLRERHELKERVEGISSTARSGPLRPPASVSPR